jgi:hypothetical protein
MTPQIKVYGWSVEVVLKSKTVITVLAMIIINTHAKAPD